MLYIGFGRNSNLNSTSDDTGTNGQEENDADKYCSDSNEIITTPERGTVSP